MMQRNGRGWYSRGFRFCSKCRAYRRTESLRCPECGTLLRRRPRNRRNPQQPRVSLEL